MKNAARNYIALIVLTISFYESLAQNIVSDKSSMVVSFNTIYRSNLIKLNVNGYDDLYLLVSEKPLNIDSSMYVISAKEYKSFTDILDTLKTYFKVYTIVRDGTSNKRNANKVNSCLLSYNNYTSGYLFTLEDSIRKYNSVIGYILQRNTLIKKVWYSVLNDNCGTFPYECKAMIKKIE